MLHYSWQPQDTPAFQFGRKNLSAAHSVNPPAQGYLTSRNTCWRIQERSLSGVTSATIHALELVFSRATSSPTLQNSHLYVSSAASLPVAPVVWSIPPGWPPRQAPCPAPHHPFMITSMTITTSTRTKPSLTSFTNSLLTYSATLVTSSSTNSSTTTSMTISNLILLTLQR